MTNAQIRQALARSPEGIRVESLLIKDGNEWAVATWVLEPQRELAAASPPGHPRNSGIRYRRDQGAHSMGSVPAPFLLCQLLRLRRRGDARTISSGHRFLDRPSGNIHRQATARHRDGLLAHPLQAESASKTGT
jgi:hypothetical protein